MQNTPVLEREAELAALSTARRRAGPGRGGWIAPTGPAGIGKTCLLEQVVTDAAAAGWFVLSTHQPALSSGPTRSPCGSQTAAATRSAGSAARAFAGRARARRCSHAEQSIVSGMVEVRSG